MDGNAQYGFSDRSSLEKTHILPLNQITILILCTGNSCRSQMAEGILKSLDKNLRVYSAGTHPANEVHPVAIQVMKEIGIDISQNHPKSLEQFLLKNFNYVITVCNEAKEVCPVFPGAAQKLHFGFEDPAKASGSEEEVLNKFRKVRDEIYIKFKEFYLNNLKL